MAVRRPGQSLVLRLAVDLELAFEDVLRGRAIQQLTDLIDPCQQRYIGPPIYRPLALSGKRYTLAFPRKKALISVRLNFSFPITRIIWPPLQIHLVLERRASTALFCYICKIAEVRSSSVAIFDSLASLLEWRLTPWIPYRRLRALS